MSLLCDLVVYSAAQKLSMQQLTLVEIEVVCCTLIAAGTGQRPDLLAVEGSFYHFLLVNNLAHLDTLARMDTRIFLPFLIIKSKYVRVKILSQ